MDCGFEGEEEEKDGGAGGVNAQKVILYHPTRHSLRNLPNIYTPWR